MSNKHTTFISGYDTVTKPYHYNWHGSGVETKEVTDTVDRWLGDAISYVWRRNHKGQPLDDRRKAVERLREWTAPRYRDLAYKRYDPVMLERIDTFIAYETKKQEDPTLFVAVLLLRSALMPAATEPLEEILAHHRTLVRMLESEIKELQVKE